MAKTFRIGIVGARGHTGRELLRLVAGHPRLELAFASSREFEGRPVAEVAPEYTGGLLFDALGPAEAAAHGADAIILALPDGVGAPFIEAIDAAAPETVIVDLSADRRFDETWAYGLPELGRTPIRGARRIANPGCYATAAQIAIAPVAEYLSQAPSVFGVSGYSGAGASPGPRNDPARLKDNLMPYALTGHKHEREVSRRLGREIQFTPHVSPAFRGILATAHLSFDRVLTRDGLKALYEKAYADEPLIRVQDDAPELKDGTGLSGVLVGGFAIGGEGRRGVVVSAEDNLLKGAAVQAIQNLNLALGIEEFAGIL